MTATSLSKRNSFYVTGGTLRRDAASYVKRQADDLLYDGLKQNKFCYVLTSRQMGKSSLMVRTAARLREEGVAVAVLDLTALGQNLTPEQWYNGLLSKIGQQVGLEDDLEQFWAEHGRVGPLQRWMAAIKQVVLKRYAGRVVIFVDEIDAVRSLPFSTDEFFAGIREFYNGRSEDPELEGLTFCLLGVATPSDLIRDTRTTPFNIGQRIELNDFTLGEAAPLAQGLRRDGELGGRLLKRVLHWTGGHPYLTQRVCRTVEEDAQVRDAAGVDRLCETLFLSSRARERDDNLLFVRERLLRSEGDLAGLLQVYSRIRKGKRVQDDETSPMVSILSLSGITRVVDGCLSVRNRIYERVFDRRWIRANMPDAELRRQRTAYRRGLVRATTIAAVILIAISALAITATREKRRADHTSEELRRAVAVAQSRELAAYAKSNSRFRPELSIRLAAEAFQSAPTEQAVEALRESFTGSFLQAELSGHTAYVYSAGFSPDGKLIVTASGDKTARVWDVNSGRAIATLQGHTAFVTNASFSPDGKWVVTASDDRTARVWEASSGRAIATLQDHIAFVTNASFSPDGKWVVTASGDKTARVWEANSGRAIAILQGHSGSVNSATFSPDGKLLVTSSSDDTARVWEARSARTGATLRGHTALVSSASFSPDGNWVVTTSRDQTARVWEAGGGREIATIRGHTGPVYGATFSPDGHWVLTDSLDETARVWEARSGRAIATLRSDSFYSPSFSPDGRWVLTTEGGKARVWEASSGREVATLQGHGDRVYRARFSPDGKRVLATSADKTRVWEASTGREIATLQGHSGSVNSASFSPDGNCVVTASSDQTARVWEASSGHAVSILQGHTGPVNSASFSPDGKWVVTASGDKTARVWEASSGRETATLQGHPNDVYGARFDPEGKWVLTLSGDRRVITVTTARLWEASSGREIATLFQQDFADRDYSVSFSPDGKWVVAVGGGNTARVWEASSGREIATLQGHSDSVRRVRFSPDGKWIVTTSQDSTAIVYPWEMFAPIDDLLALARKLGLHELTPREREEYLHGPQTK